MTSQLRNTEGLLTSQAFFEALRSERPSEPASFDSDVADRHTRELSIMMADSSGFTRFTREHGILAFLAAMTTAYDVLVPLIESRGVVLSHNADNVLAIFEAPDDAVETAIEMQRTMARRNSSLAESQRFHICIGIDHGPVIRLTDNVYGHHVNVAAKVGEDLAGRDEVLITAGVNRLLAPGIKRGYSRSADLGGAAVELYRVECPLD